MKESIQFIIKNRRSIFYALLTGLGQLFSIHLLKEKGINAFLISNAVTCLILCFEIYLNWRYATKVLRQIDMPDINVYNLWGHLLNHITLPILLFISFSGFIYFNKDDLVRLVALSLLIFINSILFINIRSYYEDKFRIETSTRYIYDIIKLFIFFFGVNLILHIQIILQLEVWVASISIALLVLLLGFLLIYRQSQVNIHTIYYIIISAFIIGVLFMLISFSPILTLGINIVIFLLFYFDISILQHKLDRSLTLEIFTEYLLTLILAFVIFAGIS